MVRKAQHISPVKKNRGEYNASCTAEGCKFSVASRFESEAQAQATFHEQKARR